MSTTTLPEIIETRCLRTRRGRGSRVECWAAKTADGRWLLQRLEMSGTPWAVLDAATKTEVDWATSLRDAREFIGSGRADAALERIRAHERGDHATTRLPACGRC